jgi:hypothetical protein
MSYPQCVVEDNRDFWQKIREHWYYPLESTILSGTRTEIRIFKERSGERDRPRKP